MNIPGGDPNPFARMQYLLGYYTGAVKEMEQELDRLAKLLDLTKDLADDGFMASIHARRLMSLADNALALKNRVRHIRNADPIRARGIESSQDAMSALSRIYIDARDIATKYL